MPIQPNQVPTATDAAAHSSLEDLRKLLDHPKPKNSDWQETSARAVAMVAIKFLGEADELGALRQVALLGLAQSLGVKEARKRTLKLSRWASLAPPVLSRLDSTDEQDAAVAALAKVTAPWSKAYIEQSLADDALRLAVVPALLKWARSLYPSPAGFTSDFFVPQLQRVTTNSELGACIFKESQRLLKPTRAEAAAEVAALLSALMLNQCDLRYESAVEKKRFGSNVKLLCAIVSEQVVHCPHVLLQPALVLAMRQLLEATAKTPAGTQVKELALNLCIATLALLKGEVEHFGAQIATEFHGMGPAWQAAYPSWKARLTETVSSCPALAGLVDGTAHRLDAVVSDTNASVSVFARLLPAWNQYTSELQDPRRVASLDLMLHDAAKAVCVETFGTKGERVGFDPLAHLLNTDDKSLPVEVFIERAGVRLRRPDGSFLILVPAIVAVTASES